MKDQLLIRAGESSSFISDDDSDEECKGDDDESMGLIPGRRGNAKSYRQKKGGAMTNAEKALKQGLDVSNLARNAMVNLRG